MSSLAATSLKAVFLGILLGFLYDLLRLIRCIAGSGSPIGKKASDFLYSHGIRDVFKSSRSFEKLFTALTDVIFCVLSTVAFILFLYAFNYGRFRWFILLSVAAGFRLHYISFGKAARTVTDTVSGYIKTVVNVALYALFVPLKAAVRGIRFISKTIFSPVFGKFKKRLDKRRNRRYTLYSIERLDDFVNIEE